MGFLDGRALKRCQKVLAPYAEAGEQVEDFEVAWVGHTKVDLISTDRTLWAFPSSGGDLSKLPYSDIAAVWMEPFSNVWILKINTRSDNVVHFEVRGQPRKLGFSVEQRFRGY